MFVRLGFFPLLAVALFPVKSVAAEPAPAPKAVMDADAIAGAPDGARRRAPSVPPPSYAGEDFSDASAPEVKVESSRRRPGRSSSDAGTGRR